MLYKNLPEFLSNHSCNFFLLMTILLLNLMQGKSGYFINSLIKFLLMPSMLAASLTFKPIFSLKFSFIYITSIYRLGTFTINCLMEGQIFLKHYIIFLLIFFPITSFLVYNFITFFCKFQ